MAMPVATMDEDHEPVFRQYNVGPAGQVLDVQPVPEAACVQVAADLDLGARVLAPNAGHHARARCSINNIHNPMMIDASEHQQETTRRTCQ